VTDRTTEELHEAVDNLLRYLDTPQTHLDKQSRRDAIERMLLKAADAARRSSDRKSTIQTVMLYGSVIAMTATLAPTALGIVKDLLGLSP